MHGGFVCTQPRSRLPTTHTAIHQPSSAGLCILRTRYPPRATFVCNLSSLLHGTLPAISLSLSLSLLLRPRANHDLPPLCITFACTQLPEQVFDASEIQSYGALPEEQVFFLVTAGPGGQQRKHIFMTTKVPCSLNPTADSMRHVSRAQLTASLASVNLTIALRSLA